MIKSKKEAWTSITIKVIMMVLRIIHRQYSSRVNLNNTWIDKKLCRKNPRQTIFYPKMLFRTKNSLKMYRKSTILLSPRTFRFKNRNNLIKIMKSENRQNKYPTKNLALLINHFWEWRMRNLNTIKQKDSWMIQVAEAWHIVEIKRNLWSTAMLTTQLWRRRWSIKN